MYPYPGNCKKDIFIPAPATWDFSFKYCIRKVFGVLKQPTYLIKKIF
jgi:hypothetical protein